MPPRWPLGFESLRCCFYKDFAPDGAAERGVHAASTLEPKERSNLPRTSLQSCDEAA